MVSEKHQELIISADEFPLFLKAKMVRDGQNVADLAKELDIHPKSAYYFLAGTRPPTKEVLKKLGLEVVYRAARAVGKK